MIQCYLSRSAVWPLFALRMKSSTVIEGEGARRHGSASRHSVPDDKDQAINQRIKIPNSTWLRVSVSQQSGDACGEISYEKHDVGKRVRHTY